MAENKTRFVNYLIVWTVGSRTVPDGQEQVRLGRISKDLGGGHVAAHVQHNALQPLHFWECGGWDRSFFGARVEGESKSLDAS